VDDSVGIWELDNFEVGGGTMTGQGLTYLHLRYPVRSPSAVVFIGTNLQ
jgi:hypothetical protein